MGWYRYDGEKNIILTLYIQTGAKHTEVAGHHGDALKIKLAAAPVEGKANIALFKFLSATFKVPLRQVVLKQGAKSRRKVIKITQSIYSPEILLG